MIDQFKKQFNNPDSLVSLFLGVAVVVVTGVLIFNYAKGKKDVATKPETTQEQQKNNANANASLPTTHTVVATDTLWSIAEKHYASGYNWVDIAQANKLTNPDKIEAGQKLTVPNVAKRPEGQTMSNAVSVNMPAGNKYTVKQGDTLWSISTSVYATGYRWQEIAKRNNLVNPNVIHVGNALMLP